MSARNVSVHDVKRIEIEEVNGADGSVWRHVNIVCEDGILQISAFPVSKGRRISTDALPVVFVRRSLGDRS